MVLIPVFWHWWALGAFLLLVELLAPGFYFLWLGVSAFITGSVLLVGVSLGIEAQLALFSILAVISIFLARRLLGRIKIESDQPLLNQRTSRFVGRVVHLDHPIVDGRGRLTLDGSIWTVTGADSPAHSTVRITRVEGISLVVEQVNL